MRCEATSSCSLLFRYRWWKRLSSRPFAHRHSSCRRPSLICRPLLSLAPLRPAAAHAAARPPHAAGRRGLPPRAVPAGPRPAGPGGGRGGGGGAGGGARRRGAAAARRPTVRQAARAAAGEGGRRAGGQVPGTAVRPQAPAGQRAGGLPRLHFNLEDAGGYISPGRVPVQSKPAWKASAYGAVA